MKVFVGYDDREDIAYKVCEYSIKRKNKKTEVFSLKQEELNETGLYWREKDPLSSTAFTFTRFLVPALMNYEGWAIFCDCDIIWMIDPDEIMKHADEKYAVMVVKHDYQPPEGEKMDGQKQLPYPRKNWSSVILWNCGHPSNKKVTPDLVNTETGQYLHRFNWLKNDEIGELTHHWNWLVNHYHEPKDGVPHVIHYTEGGPWFENYKHCEYGYHWEMIRNEMVIANTSPLPPHKYENLPPAINSIVDKLIEYRVDSNCEYYTATKDNIIDEVNKMTDNKIYGVDSDMNAVTRKGYTFDAWVQAFILGSGGQLTSYNKILNNVDVPLVIRGLKKMKAIHQCWENKNPFYYIDTGYFGNDVKRKIYHRVTLNHLQNMDPVIERPDDRLKKAGVKLTKFRKGSKILLCPPSSKVMTFFNLELDQWMEETLLELKKHTDREIIIRLKKGRSERLSTDTFEDALSKDIHCVVTYNSIAAVESLILGKPAITLGPNAAQSLCSRSLEEIENPYVPTLDEVSALMRHLSYSQFTLEELSNGYAWSILNENSNLSKRNTEE
jgi:lipopolysaccharide biosynthesis glycosyltransferase